MNRMTDFQAIENQKGLLTLNDYPPSETTPLPSASQLLDLRFGIKSVDQQVGYLFETDSQRGVLPGVTRERNLRSKIR